METKKEKAKLYEKKKEKRYEKKRQLLAYKNVDSCELCKGSKGHFRALQLHHRNPKEKEFNLSGANLDRPLAELFREASKCDVVCGACHPLIEYGSTSELPNHIQKYLGAKYSCNHRKI